MDKRNMSLLERAKLCGKSPFEATNDELAHDRFHSDIRFKSEEEKKCFYSLPDSIAGDEVKRLTIGMEKFGYDNKEKLRNLNA